MALDGDFATPRPVVLRGGTVLALDDAHRVLPGTDVLVVGDRIAAIGPDLHVPEGTREIDVRDGIVLPGMIDTHRHMWQTAMRGYGADWTLTQYFVWYYLESGRHFRPQDVHAGNLLAAAEALDASVTTCVGWSHGLQTTDHAEAAVDALRAVPGRFVLAYGNIQQAPWEWATSPEFRAFARRRIDERDDMLGFQMAFDVTGDPAFPEKAAYEVARELGVPVTTHAGVGGATNDNGIRLAHEAGFLDETSIFVHAATLAADSYHRIAATGGSVSVSTESEQSAGQGYPPTWALRAEQVVEWATRGGARALGRDGDLGSVEVGRKADLVLLRNEHSPVSFPLLNPHGHVAFQAQRGDVHTVLVNGRIVKHEHRLVGVDLGSIRREVEATVAHLRSTLGEQAWQKGMNPDVPETKILDNPYTYTDYASGATHGG
ncbi:amidohydrolase family protein [Pseudonocardia asaccharolytica]|uniref:Amidohydrolase n=1 Tax=Pseudonocardia asaccharolytica DSM 44247 = NBRC 16224 TaxID=1123024 RepID=A0A511D141_9PSEU|nr:amidohydrolase family protein [Pseudonocardia asaccharolytica]GEL17254.1 amidohydrolase [Pseudonocardia asaccharolytica DSM 44247 = NBRC 16224]